MDGWMGGCMCLHTYIGLKTHHLLQPHTNLQACEADAPEAPEASSLMSEIQAHVEKE